MNFLLVFILLLSQISSVFACNISENELTLRLAILKSEEARLAATSNNQDNFQYEDGKITRYEFIKIIEGIRRVYIPIFKKQGLRFRIESLWEDKMVNAFAGIRGGERYVLVYGGYARHPLMTKDAFISVICHEIGHHLGGYPRKAGNSWSSSEGQADYFSTLKCMKEVLNNNEENEQVARDLTLPLEVMSACRHQFPEDNDFFICLRSAKAAEDHGKVIANLTDKSNGESISLLTPSPEAVAVTNLRHPSPQCRVDTKFQGALCNAPVKTPLSPVDESIGACTFNNFNIIGNRPACWFVHKK